MCVYIYIYIYAHLENRISLMSRMLQREKQNSCKPQGWVRLYLLYYLKINMKLSMLFISICKLGIEVTHKLNT